MRTFSVSPYTSEWRDLFETFQRRLGPLFGENLMALYHIGSTSVEGLAAKPVIDILVSVRSLEDLDKSQAQFQNEGFAWRGEFGMLESGACGLSLVRADRGHRAFEMAQQQRIASAAPGAAFVIAIISSRALSH